MENQKDERLNLDNIGFFTRLFSSKFRMYLRELRHQHNLTLEEVNAKFLRDKAHWEEDKQRALNRLAEDHEIKLKEVITYVRRPPSAQKLEKRS